MKHITKTARNIIICAFAMSAGAARAQPNLVVNGSFEEPSIPNNTYRTLSNVPGWSAEDGSTNLEFWSATGGGLPAFGGVVPADGNQHLEISADAAIQTVYQVVNGLTIGYPTTFCFAYSGRPGLYDQRFEAQLSDGSGVLLAAPLNPPPYTTSVGWQQFRATFTPTESMVRIAFISRTESSTTGGAHIDHVTLTQEVPDGALTLQCPPPVIVECATSAGAPVTLTAHVQNPSGGALVVTWDVARDGTIEQTDAVLAGGPPTSADVSFTHTYLPGTTTIKVTVAEGTAPPVSCTTTVTVRTDMPPTIECPWDITVEQTSVFGAVVNFTISASDFCDAHPVVTCLPPSGSVFPVGSTTVTCSATDDQGHVSEPCSFTVTVVPPPSTCGGKVTGGGFIPGIGGGGDGDRDNFGFIVQADNAPSSTGTNSIISCTVKGNVNYVDAAGNHFQSTTLTALIVSGTHAMISGTGTINQSGVYGFVLNVEDLGEPGVADTFQIQISNGFVNGNVLGRSGNIQIH